MPNLAPTKSRPTIAAKTKRTANPNNPSLSDALFEIDKIEVHSGTKRLLYINHLTVYKNKLTTFIGPNGAGKSTLLHSLLNQHSGSGLSTTGTINNSITTHAKLIAQGHIAWVGQHERYELPLTALQYALLGTAPHLNWYQTPNQSHVQNAHKMLMDFELFDLKDTRVHYLSGGEKQRLSIVRALMQNTEILMLDEPTNHLDIRHQRFLLAYLRDLVTVQQKTVIVVLHDLTHAYRYSDDIILMDQGEVVIQGTPDEVMVSEFLDPVYQVTIESYDTQGGRVFI